MPTEASKSNERIIGTPATRRRAAGDISRSETGQQLLQVAAEMFSRRGYHGCSLRDIADVVGIQPTSMYHHFKSKQALLFTLITDAVVRQRQAVEEALSGVEGPRASLEAFARAHVRFQGEASAPCTVVHDELRALEDDNREKVEAHLREYEGLLRGVLRSGVDAGEFDVHAMDPVVAGFLDAWDGVAAWYRPDGALSLSGIAEMYAAMALATVAVERPIVAAVAVADGPDEEPTARDRILAVATELIASHGCHGMSLRDLASGAEVRPALVYYHFGSKEQLLYVILSRQMREALKEFRVLAASHRDPVERLAAMVRFQVRFDSQRRKAAMVSDSDLDALTEEHRRAVVAQRREYEELIASAIRQGVEEGAFGVPNVNIATFGIIRMCTGAGRRVPEGVSPEQLEETADRYVEVALAWVGARPEAGDGQLEEAG